jgi:hypothetical protein
MDGVLDMNGFTVRRRYRAGHGPMWRPTASSWRGHAAVVAAGVTSLEQFWRSHRAGGFVP